MGKCARPIKFLIILDNTVIDNARMDHNVITEQVISVFTVGHSCLIFVFPDEML